MLSWRTRSRARHPRADLSAYLDERSEIDGTYTFGGTAMLNGRFKGVIQSTDTLIVGEKAVVAATITAGCVVIHGEVVGNVTATERPELRGAARMVGDVDTPVLVVEEGVVFQGHCRMTTPHPEVAREPRDLSVVALKR